jgi:hypothetical protein
MRTLGICWILYSVYRIAVGVLALVMIPTATVMFGALLARVNDPYSMMSVFHALYMCWIGLSFVCAALGILGGLALMRNTNDGRLLLAAASLFSLSDLPFGVAIGVYTLIALASSRVMVKPAAAD